MTQEELGTLFRNLDGLDSITDELVGLAEAFRITGNDVMANKMANIYSGIQHRTTEMRHIIARSTNKAAGL